MSKELEVLFNSKARPKILKLFFQNEEATFNLKDISKKCQISKRIVQKELKKLRKIKLLKFKIQKRKKVYSLNPKFLFLSEIRAMIFRLTPLYLSDLKPLFRRNKKIKLLVASGVFLQEKKSPIDLLIVGDKIKKSKITRQIRRLESEVGRDIKWSLMTAEEFDYRTEMHDRFLKDIFDHSHKKIIDRLKT
mgnify:CR=1 FL=1